MSNLNSVSHSSTLHKSLLFLIVLSALCLMCNACASVSSGSSSKHTSTLVSGSYDKIHVPEYAEYEVLSLVFATTEEYADIDMPYLTYLALLKKAQEIGGHDIVNVSIEESRNCSKISSGIGPYKRDDTVCKIKRFGAALAIKYTKPILDGPIVQRMNQKQEDSSSSSQSSESKSLVPFL